MKRTTKNFISQYEIEARREERDSLIQFARIHLSRYATCQRDVEYLDSRLSNAKSQVEPGAVKPKTLAPGVPDETSNPTGKLSRTEDKILKVIELGEALDEAVDRRDSTKKEIENRIKMLEDKLFRDILTAVYIDNMPVAQVRVGYEKRSVYYKMDEALFAYGKNFAQNAQNAQNAHEKA